MESKSTALNLVIEAALKLDARTPEWRNVIAFIESCYCCRARDYDLDAAVACLTKLTDEEQHALIAWTMLVEDMGRARAGRRQDLP
jgi:hypothetical protein